jgi:hypothetical protein
VSSVHYIFQQPFPGNDFYRGRFFSFPQSGPLVTAARLEFLSTDNSTNWVPVWRPYYTNLLFSSQADFQLTTELYSPTGDITLLHSTEFPTTPSNNCFVFRVRVRVILRLAVYRQSVCLGTKPLETHDQQFLFQLNSSCHSPYITSSLTRGWICRLQLLVVLASAVILESKSSGIHDHTLLSEIRDPNLEGYVPVFLFPRKSVAQSYPQALVSFLSLPTTRRAKVEIFEPASTQSCFVVKVKVKVTLLLAIYRQSVRLGVRHLETHDQITFFQLNSCGNNPYVTSSLTRRWICLL